MAIFVSIEGVDCAGKFTTAKKVATALKHTESLKGTPIHMVSFPVYELDSGKMLKRYLNGDYTPNDPSVFRRHDFFPMLYSMNRLEFFKTTKLDPNAIYIFDRYVASNLIHQASHLWKAWNSTERPDNTPTQVIELFEKQSLDSARMSYDNWVHFEYENGAPKIPANLSFMLMIDIDTAMERLARRKNGKHEGTDILESRNRISEAIDFMNTYREAYSKSEKSQFTYIDVPANDPTQQIYDAIMKEVNKNADVVPDTK